MNTENKFYDLLDGQLINDEKVDVKFNKRSIDIMLIDKDGYNTYGNTFYSVYDAYDFLKMNGCLEKKGN